MQHSRRSPSCLPVLWALHLYVRATFITPYTQLCGSFYTTSTMPHNLLPVQLNLQLPPHHKLLPLRLSPLSLPLHPTPLQQHQLQRQSPAAVVLVRGSMCGGWKPTSPPELHSSVSRQSTEQCSKYLGRSPEKHTRRCSLGEELGVTLGCVHTAAYDRHVVPHLVVLSSGYNCAHYRHIMPLSTQQQHFAAHTESALQRCMARLLTWHCNHSKADVRIGISVPCVQCNIFWQSGTVSFSACDQCPLLLTCLLSPESRPPTWDVDNPPMHIQPSGEACHTLQAITHH
jgi:hypothetical protein